MARSRGSGRRPGKSDPIDAEAVARVVLREPDLPVASHDEVSRECKLLVDRREDLEWVSARRQSTGLCGAYTNWTQHAHPAY
jgi:transposase